MQSSEVVYPTLTDYKNKYHIRYGHFDDNAMTVEDLLNRIQTLLDQKMITPATKISNGFNPITIIGVDLPYHNLTIH